MSDYQGDFASSSYKMWEANVFLLPNGETGEERRERGLAVWLKKEAGKALYILLARGKVLWPRERQVRDGKAGQGDLVWSVSPSVPGRLSFAKPFSLPQPHFPVRTVVWD